MTGYPNISDDPIFSFEKIINFSYWISDFSVLGLNRIFPDPELSKIRNLDRIRLSEANTLSVINKSYLTRLLQTHLKCTT